MKRSINTPLGRLAKFAKAREKALRYGRGSLTATEAAAISRILHEANTWQHLPPAKQALKVQGLANQVEILKSKNYRLREQTRKIKQLVSPQIAWK